MQIVIIGNGISGVTAARHIRKGSDHRITLISDESDYFYSRTALMYIYMGHLTFEQTKPYDDGFWARNRIDRIRDRVAEVRPDSKTLLLSQGREIAYDRLVIATGSKPNKYGWPGQDLEGVQGLYSLQDLEQLGQNAPDKKACRRAVIVGGGLIGIELAEMLKSRDIPVTFLVRESSFWNGVLPDWDSALLNRHIREHHIDLRLQTSLKEILPGENGRVRAVVTGSGETIPCDLVGLTAGVSPNIDFLKGSGIDLDRGVLVNRHLETNLPGIYAIGDCAQQRVPLEGRKAVEAVWYTGRMMGETLAQTLCGRPTEYRPGPWFNSAKFFDVEYQTYGRVSPDRTRPADEAQFHWRHADKPLSLTLAYRNTDGSFLGVNALGIRLRHEVFERWLNERQTIGAVVKHLGQAFFDPELTADYSLQIRRAYEQNQPQLL